MLKVCYPVIENIVKEIVKLKKENNAIILAHNYQSPEIQDIADYTGDSLELARIATKSDCDVIVFCGVKFMGETAHILSPEKTVLLPEKNAGCPLAEMVTIEKLKELQDENPGAVTVCYVNSSALIKANSDVCCTSANAVKIIAALDKETPIIFVPCKHLGGYAARVTGRNVILADGYCTVHKKIIPEDIIALKNKMPDAVVLTHPECSEKVIELSDYICSTSQMFAAIETSNAKRFIICTEVGMLTPLRKRYPDKEFFPTSERVVCGDMKKTTLNKVLTSLQTMQPKVELDPDIRQKALKSLERMLEYV